MKKFFLFFFWFTISSYGYAYDFEIDGVLYSIVSLDDKTVSVVRGDYETFHNGYYKGDIFIPSQVEYNGKTLRVVKIDDWAFTGCNITSIQLSEGLQEIGQNAFSDCKSLKEIVIPNSISTIANFAFLNCENLNIVNLPNTLIYLGISSFGNCSKLKLQNEQLPSLLDRIYFGTFKYCWAIKRIVIPNTIKTIDNAFDNTSLSYLRIEDGETPISLGAGDVYSSPGYNRYYNGTFTDCKIDSLYLGRNVVYKTGNEENAGYYNHYNTPFYKNDGIKYLNIGEKVTNIPTFYDSSLKIILCQSEKPFEIEAETFSNSTYAGAILYVPTGSKSSYESDVNWGKFFNIQEMDVEEMNNKSVSNISQVKENAVFIQSSNGIVTVSGLDNGTNITIYSVSGNLVGSAKAFGNQSSIATNLKAGDIAIIKIGEKSVKVVMQ